MKKIILVFLVVFLICVAMALKSIAQDKSEDSSSSKALIAYFSYTGNTQNIANQISKLVGGDIFRIEPAKDYPQNIQEVLKMSKEEINNNYKPALKKKVNNLEQYEIIFIGTPNWYSTIAPPVASFLSEYDLSGKKVIPFLTHGGGGKANCFTDMKKLIPDATVLKGIAVFEGDINSSNQKLLEWLKEVKIL
ncbi:flavodoxin [Candidatus Omnitrophota bacterium]